MRTRPAPAGKPDDAVQPARASNDEQIDALNIGVADMATWCGGGSYEISCSEDACAVRPLRAGLWNFARRPMMALELMAVQLGAPAELNRCQAATTRGPMAIAAPNEPRCFVVGVNGPIDDGAARDDLCAATR